MKNFMKLFAAPAVLIFGAMIADAQDARGMYIGYTAGNASKPPVKTPKKPKKPVKQNQGGNKPPVIIESAGAAPAATGLPGTKVTIELNRKGRLSFVKPNYKFRSGDKIRLRLQTNFEGYVSLLNVGSTGEIEFLYPYQGADNHIYPSKDIQIPSSEAWIVFDEKPGTENLTVVMSKEVLSKSAGNYDDVRQSNSRDLLIEYADDGVYAVTGEDKITKPVGFTLKLQHGR